MSVVTETVMDVAGRRLEDIVVSLFGVDPDAVEVTARDDGDLTTLQARWPSDE